MKNDTPTYIQSRGRTFRFPSIQLGRDPVLEMMLEEGLPLTETVYLEMQYPEGIPNPVPPELLAAMPPEVKGKKGD